MTARGIVLVLLSLLAAASAWSITTYDSLVRSQGRVDAAWVQVRNVEQRRAELIPRLVVVTQTYAAHERTILQLIQAGGEPADTGEDHGLAIARDQRLDGAVAAVRALADRYPRLHAAELYRNLDVELRGSENRIAIERERYDRAVAEYRTRLRRLPVSLFARGARLPAMYAPRPEVNP